MGARIIPIGQFGMHKAAAARKSLADTQYQDAFDIRAAFFSKFPPVLADYLNRQGAGIFIGRDVRVGQSGHFPKGAHALTIGEKNGFPDWQAVCEFFTWQPGLAGFGGMKRVTPLKIIGENRTYRLHMEESDILLKHYPEADGDRDAQELETRHIAALRKVGIDQVPEPVWQSDRWAMFRFVEGVRPTGTNADRAQIARFLTQLDQSGALLAKADLSMAIDARLKLEDYGSAVNKLWNKVFKAAQAKYSDIMLWMMTDLEQMRQDNINHFYLWCKRERWDRQAELAPKERVFSPSDFGLHNTLRKPGGQLIFLDFEDSGWDDPAKLMADFFHNFENDLPIAAKLEVLDHFAKNRDWNPKFIQRFWAVADIVAVEWILRTLYLIDPTEKQRLEAKYPGLDHANLVAERFAQAKAMRDQYQPMERVCKHNQLLDEDATI
jgi:hypothetical protein